MPKGAAEALGRFEGNLANPTAETLQVLGDFIRQGVSDSTLVERIANDWERYRWLNRRFKELDPLGLALVMPERAEFKPLYYAAIARVTRRHVDGLDRVIILRLKNTTFRYERDISDILVERGVYLRILSLVDPDQHKKYSVSEPHLTIMEQLHRIERNVHIASFLTGAGVFVSFGLGIFVFWRALNPFASRDRDLKSLLNELKNDLEIASLDPKISKFSNPSWGISGFSLNFGDPKDQIRIDVWPTVTGATMALWDPSGYVYKHSIALKEKNPTQGFLNSVKQTSGFRQLTRRAA